MIMAGYIIVYHMLMSSDPGLSIAFTVFHAENKRLPGGHFMTTLFIYYASAGNSTCLILGSFLMN